MTKEEILNGMSEQEFYSLYPTREAWEQVQQQMAYGGMPNIMGIPFGAGVIMEEGGNLSEEYIKKARTKPGGSNVGKYNPNQTFAGPSGGAPKGSYPIGDIQHARSALKLAHNAPNPSGIKAAVYNKYPSLKKQAGGTMTQDLEGTYPSFGYGGYDSPFNYGQFPGMAHGGNTTSQGGNQDFLNNRNNTYLNYIQNNVLKNIQQEESEKVQNAFMQMENSYRMGGAPCYECGGYHMQGGGSYDMLNQQNLALQNMYGQQMQQYQDQHAQDRAAFANLFLPQDAEGAQQPDHGALLHQFAEEFGPRSRRTGLPLFPANLSPYYQIGKKDAAKLAGLPKNFKMEGLEITPKWGLGARTAMNIGNLFRSKENDRTTPGWAPKSIHYKFTGKRGYMPGEPRPDTHETVQQSAIGPKTTYDQANPYGPIPAGTTQASVPYLPSSIRPGYNASGKMINEKYPGLTPSYISSSSQFNTMAYGGDYFDGGGNYPTLFGTQNNPIDLKGSTTNQWSFAGQQSAPTPTAAGVYGKPALSIDTRNQTEDSPYVQGSQVQYDAAKDRSNEDITVEGDIDKKWKGIRETIGQYAIPTLNFVSSGLENKNYKKFKKKMEASMLADNAFVTTPLNAKNRGDYDINSGILRSDDYVPVQFPGYAQWGGFNTMAVGGSYEKDQELRQAQSGLEVKMNPGLYGTNGNSQFNKSAHLEAGKISQKPTEVRNSLTAVPRDKANLEAEGGETAIVNVDGIPAHFKISGPRHTNGGVPLDLPDNSFIFSDTAKMKIKDPNILAQFGMKPKRGGYTPADISKKYDINKFRKILADPNTDDMQRKTAEMMIANYNEKLAKLALAQESIKGFPQGIPVIAMPYIENMQMNPATFLPDQAQEQLEGAEQPDADMGTARYGSQVINQFPIKRYGGLPKAQSGLSPNTAPKKSKEETSKDLDVMERRILGTIQDLRSKGLELPTSITDAYKKVDTAKRALGQAPESKPYKGEMSWVTAEGNPIDDPKQGATGYLDRVGQHWSNDFDPYNVDPKELERVSKLKGYSFMEVPTKRGKAAQEIVSKLNPYNSEGIIDYAGNILSAPQKGINAALTGNIETPGITYLRTNPGNEGTALLIDVVSDPLTYLGPKGIEYGVKGAYKGVQKFLPYAKDLAEFTIKYGKQAGKYLAENLPKLGKYISKKGIEALKSEVVQNLALSSIARAGSYGSYQKANEEFSGKNEQIEKLKNELEQLKQAKQDTTSVLQPAKPKVDTTKVAPADTTMTETQYNWD